MGIEEEIRHFYLSNSEWGLIIRLADNGFIVQANDGSWRTFEDSKEDEQEGDHINSMVDLIYFILDFFSINLSRYAKRRVFPHIEAGDKYMPKEGEKIEKEYYCVIKACNAFNEIKEKK